MLSEYNLDFFFGVCFYGKITNGFGNGVHCIIRFKFIFPHITEKDLSMTMTIDKKCR